jgi:adenine deaminase
MSVTIGRNTNILKEMLRIPSTPPKTVNRLILAPNTVNRLILASKTVKAIGGGLYVNENRKKYFRLKLPYIYGLFMD